MTILAAVRSPALVYGTRPIAQRAYSVPLWVNVPPEGSGRRTSATRLSPVPRQLLRYGGPRSLVLTQGRASYYQWCGAEAETHCRFANCRARAILALSLQW